MQVAIRKMGNSHGMLIPKPIHLSSGLQNPAQFSGQARTDLARSNWHIRQTAAHSAGAVHAATLTRTLKTLQEMFEPVTG